ncbi:MULTISPECIES: TMEM175 family protein [unclassified Streptomyces]|uniref:TMEM175 family protein n=1 Tax=unclassified Streptomyces TaxID=2593676 RepID=UPI00331D766C
MARIDEPETAGLAGDPGRLLALSDGIFAIAMTLLVLDVAVPDDLGIRDFQESLRGLWPKVAAYGLSFTILAAFWMDHRRIFLWVRQVDDAVLRVSLSGLGAIALLPFPTSLLAEYPARTVSVALYAGTIAVTNLLHLALFALVWRRSRLQHEPIGNHVGRAVVADLVISIVVFGASVGIAFVSPRAAMWSWALLLPVKVVMGRRAQTGARTR